MQNVEALKSAVVRGEAPGPRLDGEITERLVAAASRGDAREIVSVCQEASSSVQLLDDCGERALLALARGVQRESDLRCDDAHARGKPSEARVDVARIEIRYFEAAEALFSVCPFKVSRDACIQLFDAALDERFPRLFACFRLHLDYSPTNDPYATLILAAHRGLVEHVNMLLSGINYEIANKLVCSVEGVTKPSQLRKALNAALLERHHGTAALLFRGGAKLTEDDLTQLMHPDDGSMLLTLIEACPPRESASFVKKAFLPAMKAHNLPAITVLRKNGLRAPDWALYYMVRENNANFARALFPGGVVLNLQKAMSVASHFNCPDVYRVLVQCARNEMVKWYAEELEINAKSAAIFGHGEMLRVMLENGANAKDAELLHRAKLHFGRTRNPSALRVLEEHGASADDDARPQIVVLPREGRVH